MQLGGYGQKQYQVLCYHNVVIDDDSVQSDDVSIKTLVLHFEWLKKEKFQPISLQEIIEGKTFSNDKQVLFSFDDGYSSFYKYVFPLLKLYQFKAVVALVGSFQEESVDSVQYTSEKKLPRSHFLTWAQINEMEESGLVEFISHSYDLHKAVQSNKQGNFSPSATTIQFDSARNKFETFQEYESRIRLDLIKSKQQLQKRLRKFVPCIVWPYGRYNTTVTRIAEEVGFKYSLNLVGESNYDFESNKSINRFYINNSGSLEQLRSYLNTRSNDLPITKSLILSNSDILSDSDSANEIKLGQLLEKLKLLGANSIALPLFADSNTVYFVNNYLPYKFNQLFRVIWQLQTRLDVEAGIYINSTTAKANLQTEQWQGFWEQLGRQAPVRKIILESEELINFFETNNIQARVARVSNPITQANNRKKYLSANYKDIQDLQLLESLVQIQPDISVFLVLPSYKINLISDSTALNTWMFYFSGVVIDYSDISDIRQLNKQIKSLRLPPHHFNRIQVRLPFLSEQVSKKLIQTMHKKGFFSYFLNASDVFKHNYLRTYTNTKDKAILPYE